MTAPSRPPREIGGKGRTIRDARQGLYQALAERIWSPERLAQEAAS